MWLSRPLKVIMDGFLQIWLHNIYELNTAHKIDILTRNVVWKFVYNRSLIIKEQDIIIRFLFTVVSWYPVPLD